MKKLLLTISLFLCLISLNAQGLYSLEPIAVCWSIGAVDSNLVAYWQLSIREDQPKVVSYLDPTNGQIVDISGGGTLSAGYCCCKNGGSGGGSSVTINDLGNGLYDVIVDGDTTQINTQADMNPITTPIQIGDSTYLSGTVVQDILIALSNQVNTASAETACPDTVSQTAHGFTLGALLGQDQATGTYFPANTASTDSLPVAYVCSVIDANTFTVDTEGWLDWTHGQTVRTDYFLQDNGTYAPSPDADYTVFAYRTFKANKAYFDIPELIVDPGSSGGGGGTKNVTASNGLNDQNAAADVDVELGGTLDKTTSVETEGFRLRMGDQTGTQQGYFQISSIATLDLFVNNTGTSEETSISCIPSGTSIETNLGVGDSGIVNVEDNVISLTINVSSSLVSRLEVTPNGFTIIGLPNYANDAAADADGTLPSGGIYTVTAENRSIRIKP